MLHPLSIEFEMIINYAICNGERTHASGIREVVIINWNPIHINFTPFSIVIIFIFIQFILNCLPLSLSLLPLSVNDIGNVALLVHYIHIYICRSVESFTAVTVMSHILRKNGRRLQATLSKQNSPNIAFYIHFHFLPVRLMTLPVPVHVCCARRTKV